MKEKKAIKEKSLDEIAKEFDKILKERGFENIRIQSFRQELNQRRTCIRHEWVVRNGVRYKRCLEWSD